MKFPFFSTYLTRKFSAASLFTLFLFSVILGGFLSVYSGIDANYDFKKYHLHNAWAFLQGRLEVDLFPAGLQTFYSPLLDVPYYWLAVEWFPNSPRIVTFLMGIPTGILFFLTLVCIYQILKSLDGLSEVSRQIYTALLSLFGFTGTAVIIQIGSTTNEVQSACFVLGAIATYLLYDKRVLLGVGFSGFLLGVGVGLKLTAVEYTPAFLLGILLFAAGGWRERVRIFFVFCSAWWVAFFAIYGYWGWTVYKITGNPVFPMYNNIFRSDWLPNIALPGSWFVPQTWNEILFFPFSWVNARAVSASACTDFRFAIALVFGGTFFIYEILQRFLAKRENRESRQRGVVGFLFTFLFLSYALWEMLFSVLRYAIPLEIFLGVVPFVCVWRIWKGNQPKDFQNSVNANIVMLAVFIPLFAVVLGTTKYPSWGRIRASGNAVFSVSAPKLHENSLVFLYTPETQFLAPFIAKENPSVTFVSPGDDPLFLAQAMRNSGLHKKVLERIQKHDAPICVLVHPGHSYFLRNLPEFGLYVDKKIYSVVRTNYGNFYLYHAQKMDESEEENSAAKKYFVENLIVLNVAEKDARGGIPLIKNGRAIFSAGWSENESFRVRKSAARQSVVEFFLTPEEAEKSRILEISGNIAKRHSFVVELNGERIFSFFNEGLIAENSTGEDSAESFRISLPARLLREKAKGANVLQFMFPNARAADDLPWPLVRRPRSGKLPLLSFTLRELVLLPENAAELKFHE